MIFIYFMMGLLMYKYEPFWQEVSVKSLILRWLIRPVIFVLINVNAKSISSCSSYMLIFLDLLSLFNVDLDPCPCRLLIDWLDSVLPLVVYWLIGYCFIPCRLLIDWLDRVLPLVVYEILNVFEICSRKFFIGYFLQVAGVFIHLVPKWKYGPSL